MEIRGISRNGVFERLKFHNPMHKIAFEPATCVALEGVVMDTHVVAEVVEIELEISGRALDGLRGLRTSFPGQ